MLTPNTMNKYNVFSLNECGEAAWLILVDFFEDEPNLVSRGRYPRGWNEPNESCRHLSEKGSKCRFFVPDRVENHSNEGKAKENKKERGARKKGEDKKEMVAPLIFTLEPLLWDISIPRTQHLFRENVHKIFVLVTSIEGTPPSGERITFCGSRNPLLTSLQGTP